MLILLTIICLQSALKTLVPASYNALSTNVRGYRLLKATRRYNILDALAGLRVHTTPTLEWYQEELPRFSGDIKVGVNKINTLCYIYQCI